MPPLSPTNDSFIRVYQETELFLSYINCFSTSLLLQPNIKAQTKKVMGGTKRWVLFKRFVTKEAWRWKCFGSAFKWKRLNIKRSFVDNVVFKLVSVLEAIYLVATLCFFYLCCGCHF
ncbi:hypothetical protein ERO13_D05G152400v2 [Gossypium hirsutum]|nr:hypothetical protein ERO13_D05G152400v2 [Gossypium hirsutum]